MNTQAWCYVGIALLIYFIFFIFFAHYFVSTVVPVGQTTPVPGYNCIFDTHYFFFFHFLCSVGLFEIRTDAPVFSHMFSVYVLSLARLFFHGVTILLICACVVLLSVIRQSRFGFVLFFPVFITG